MRGGARTQTEVAHGEYKDDAGGQESAHQANQDGLRGQRRETAEKHRTETGQ